MKMIIGKTLFILVLLLLKSSELTGQEDDDDNTPDEDELTEEEKKTVFENVEPRSPGQKNWMAKLDNNKFISDITIPGTHDTMALYGGSMAKCQTWSLENQLKAGIRYLDLRVSGYKLKIMHGIIYQRTSLSEVISTIRKFLQESKNEFVLVRIKPEFPQKGRVQNLVENLIGNDNNIWKKSTIPTIGEVRGKIVLVQKNRFKLGISLSETDSKGDYKVTKTEDKKKKITQHLEEANKQCKSNNNNNNNNNKISLVYSSGTSLGTYKGFCLLPNAVAGEINPWLNDHLKELSNKNPKSCFGIIAMDFPYFELIEMIIKFNT
uniref:Phosphatidylinositol-specific phospholipase C X domain-containing protein n=1 Tax=Cyprinus carpio TaxID=7962 RepID=A0A8C1SJ68_CYPCA